MADLTQIRLWAERHIRHYLDDSWSFGYDNAKQRAGLCNFTRKHISLSRYLTARFSDDEARQVVLHEIAHGLAGPRVGHSQQWLTIARSIGYTGGTRHSNPGAVELAPWVGSCPSGHIVYRHRRPTREQSCARCSRTYNPAYRFSWIRRTITARDRALAAQPR